MKTLAGGASVLASRFGCLQVGGSPGVSPHRYTESVSICVNLWLII